MVRRVVQHVVSHGTDCNKLVEGGLHSVPRVGLGPYHFSLFCYFLIVLSSVIK